MEADHGCEKSQRLPNVGYPLDDPKRLLLDEWTSGLSQIWIKRRGPEWKPRRASVATCQQQQQLMAQHCGYKSAYQFNMANASLKELILQTRLHHNQHQLQQQQQQQQQQQVQMQMQRNYTPNNNMTDCCMHKDAVENFLSERILSDQVKKNQDSGSELIVFTDKSTNPETDISQQVNDRKHHPGSTTTTVPTSEKATSTTTATSLVDSNGRPAPDSGSVVDDMSLSKPRSDSSIVSIEDGQGRAVNKLCTASLNSTGGNRTAVNSATCCSDLKSETATPPPSAPMDCVGEDALKVALNEKLQIQDRQRKHVILSMALRQLMASRGNNVLNSQMDKSVADRNCCECSGNSRSRSCSFGTARAATESDFLTSALVSSRSVVSDIKHHSQAAEIAAEIVTETTQAAYSRLSQENSTIKALSNNGTSLADKTSRLRKRHSVVYEGKNKDEIITFKHQLIAHQAKSSLGQDHPREIGAMRQLVTSITSTECEDNNRCHNQVMPNDQHQDGRSYDRIIRPGTTLDHMHRDSSTRAQNRPERRSCGALGRDNSTRGNTTIYGHPPPSDQFDINLEELIIESWLDDHPAFTREYFMRKATRQIVDDWLIANAKVSNTNWSSQADLRSINSISRPVSQMSLGGYLREPSWKGSENIPTDIDEYDSSSFDSLRPVRSNSQSGVVTSSKALKPTRKISATDFETRTGSGFLRPMLNKTPDGRLSFLLQPRPSTREIDCYHEPKVSRTPDGHQSKDASTIELTQQQPNRSNVTIEVDRSSEANATSNGVDINENNRIDEEIDERPNDSEVKLIFELVENIYDDLDIRTLLHKILKNIAVLINADRSSLFLVCGGPGDPNRRLVSQLFNVDQDSIDDGEPEESIVIPWGKGLVGYVAESGETINITNCYDDPRFTDAIDQRTGYRTRHMICAPILDKCNEIVGVAQVINKRDGRPFSKCDEVKFKRYLQFCGIGLRNAQSYEQCELENRRNQVLLDLARMVFEEQSTIEQVVHRIMLHTQSLLDCERCQVLLIDDGNDELENIHRISSHRNSTSGQANESLLHKQRDGESMTLHKQATNLENHSDESSHNTGKSQQASPKLFTLVFDLECDGNDPVIHDSKKEASMCGSKKSRAFPINIGITGYVAMTGETLNIKNAHQHERFDLSVDEASDFWHKSILCMPIRNGQRKIIGVIQLINKKNGQPFNKNDEDLFEAFAIFCGLGIHNTLMYERVLKIMAKQKVTFEVLSYHATAPLEEAKKLSQEQIPSCFALNLASLKFNDFSLDDQYMLKSCLRFFLDLDLIRRFQIDRLVFCNWILSVQKNYRKETYHPIVGGDGLKASPVRYHNWRHAFNVSQMMFAILVNTQLCHTLGELETLALLIACLCHDLDHRGTNNSFQIKSASPLAELYSTSTMEHHHFDQCVMILNSQGNQILANLSPEEYSKVIMLLEEAIIATDLANYFRNRDLFFQLVNSNKFEWKNDCEHRSLLRRMLMTACDVAAITKPWSVQKVVADLVMSEFYQQGDIERNELKIEPIDMMNRDKMNELPSLQIGFIDTICAPIYTAFAKLFPDELTTLLDGCLTNRNVWRELAEGNKQQEIPLIRHITCDNDGPNEKNPTLPSNVISKSDINIPTETDRNESISKHRPTYISTSQRKSI